MKTRWSALTVLILVALAAPAVAQLEMGRFAGTVTDTQGAVLPGVTVTATSPALIGTQVAITEGDGKFRFPSLPSGRYVLTFEMPSFQTVRRENIVLALGQTLTIDMQMPLATFAETVTVSGESPVVDVQSTKVGSEFSGEKLVGIPSATDIWGTLGQAPGIRMNGFDVGGSHKSQQSNYESFGIRNQNRVLNDGVDTTEGDGGAGFYADFFVNDEIAVSAAGGDVEMNTPGAAVFSTVKSGGNTYKGLYNLTYEGENFVGDNIDEATSKRGFTGQPNLIFWEGHADLGGPIKKDKVWFFAAYNHFKIDKVISGVRREIATDVGIFDNITVKGTWKATGHDTLVGYYQRGRKQKPFRGLSATVPAESALAQDSVSWVYKGEYQRVWTNRLFTTTRVGLFGYTWPMAPKVDFKVSPPRVDTATNVESGAGWLSGDPGGPFNADRNKPQVSTTLTYFLPDKAGSHDLKTGFEWQDDQSAFANNGNSGPILYRDRGGQVDEVRITDYASFDSFGSEWTGNDDRNTRIAVFLQDRWNPRNRLALTLGVRLERQSPHYQPSIRKAAISEVFPPATVPGKTLLTSTTASPRVGISYDPSGDGKSVIKGFFGRYYFNYADRLASLNPGGTNYRQYKFLDQNRNRLYDGLQELGTLVSSSGGTSTTLDPDLKTPYTDEVSVAFERQFWGESSGRIAYVRKMSRNDFGAINVLREGQFTVPTAIPVTLQSFDGGVERVQTFTLMDIPASLRGRVQNVVTNLPDIDANYDTLQFGLNKRFAGGLFLQGSFDYQWRDELRRASGPSTSPLNTDPLAIGYYQNVYPDVPNRQESTNWQGRLMGRYVFPADVGVAVNLRAQSGFAYSRVITTADLPNAGTQTFFQENISNNRSDKTAILDLRLDKAFKLGRYRITGMADLFNALNSNAVTNFNLLNGPAFNKIIATLDPRTAQVGIRFDF